MYWCRSGGTMWSRCTALRRRWVFKPTRELNASETLTYRLGNCPYRDAAHERQQVVCGLQPSDSQPASGRSDVPGHVRDAHGVIEARPAGRRGVCAVYRWAPRVHVSCDQRCGRALNSVRGIWELPSRRMVLPKHSRLRSYRV